MSGWYNYYKNSDGKPIFPGVYFSSLAEPISIIKESDTLVLFKKHGSTVYIPRKMVYSSPELFLIRKTTTYNEGSFTYQKTELIKAIEYTRATAKTSFLEMLELMNAIDATESIQNAT